MKVEAIVASRFRSDGGTIFGPVPKGIWSGVMPADERNTIPQHANVLLITLDDGTVGLVDAGCGDAAGYSEKQLLYSGLGPGWPLMEELAARGIAAADVAFVVMSHLHWDHALGLLRPDGSLSFPNATVYVDLHEMMDAEKENPLLYQAYPVEKIQAIGRQSSVRRCLHKAHQVTSTVFPGIQLARTGGHTQHHCMVLIEAREGEVLEVNGLSGIRRVVFAGDVCPTRHHLHPAWQTGYDTMPLETRRWKQTWLPQLAREDTVLMFYHDPEVFGGSIRMVDERAKLVTEWRI